MAEPSPVDPALRDVLDADGLSAHFQPIVRVGDGELIAYEALARPQEAGFPGPAELLAAAGRSGLRVQAELACWRAAARAGAPPERRMLFLNVSPAALADPGFLELADVLPRPLVVELTERDAIEDFHALRRLLEPWTDRGALVAIDDVGTGFASLQWVLELGPQFVKVARRLVSGVHLDRRRRSMIAGLVSYAEDTGITLVAEGVELPEELSVLASLGVHWVQGHLLAAPGPPWPEHAPVAACCPEAAPRHAARPSTSGRLSAARDVHSACLLVVEEFARRELLMPSIYLERGGVLRCHGLRGYWQLLDGFPTGAGVIGTVFGTGEPMLVENVLESPEYLEASPAVSSEACVPIRVGGRVAGAFNVESAARFPAGLLEEMEAAAAALGERIDELGGMPAATAADRLVRHVAELAGQTDAEAVAQGITAAACDVLDAQSAAVALRAGSGALDVRAAQGPLAPVFAALASGVLAQMEGWVAGVRSCYTLGELAGQGFVGHEALRAAGAEALVVVPVQSGRRRHGIIVAAHPEARVFSTDDIELVELLGAHAASCLDTAEAMAALADRAERDPLTGLCHHASFHAALRSAREETSAPRHVGVLLVDVDGFKAVNDTRGHLAGDQLLRSVAAALSGALRASDRLFRIGGDEFAVLVEVLDGEEAQLVAERLVHAVRRLETTTVSVGVAVASSGESDGDLFARADEALYAVKRAGRDGVAVAAGAGAAREQASLWD